MTSTEPGTSGRMSSMCNMCMCMRGRRKRDAGDKTSKVTNNSAEDLKPVGEVAANGAGKKGGPKATKGGSQSPVLVELFTSQGCSSCPPGDALISKLGRGQGEEAGKLSVPIIVLAFHVDYWDYLGWKDPFASPKWTLRQRTYGQALQQDSIYTPEVVVQGRSQCIASNASAIMSLVQDAPRFAAPDVHVKFAQPTTAELKVSVTVTLKTKVDTLDVMVAMYENGLVTDCNMGENRGRILTNDFVVMEMEKACTIQGLPSKKAVQCEASIQLWEGFSPTKCGIVVFFQNPVSLEIFGAQQVDLPGDLK